MGTAAPEIAEGSVVLDKYQIEAPLGAGDVGQVYKAVHQAVGSHVALKLLLPEHRAQPSLAHTFATETKKAQSIVSDHLIRIFESGSSEALGPYLVCEHFELGDLDATVRKRGPLSVEEAIDAVVQASLALAEIHAAGSVHRGVKPSNLMLGKLDDARVIKLADVGHSRVLKRPPLTSAWFWSPERLEAAADLDHTEDIFALGVTLYWLLTKLYPYEATSIEELQAVLRHGAPRDLMLLRPDLPEKLARAVPVAFSASPDARYQTVGELCASLAPFAGPRTLKDIEALARRELRRSIGALPRSRNPSNPPPSLRTLKVKPDAPPIDSTPKPVVPAAPEESSGTTLIWVGVAAFLLLIGAAIVYAALLR